MSLASAVINEIRSKFVGKSKWLLDTPCLVINQTALRRNVTEMNKRASDVGKKLRPHSKTHKCSTIAKIQIQEGAIGISATKVSEAKALLDAGVTGELLITSPVVTQLKIDTLMKCLLQTKSTNQSSVMVVVDSEENALELDKRVGSLAEDNLKLKVLVDIDGGQHRTGVSYEDALSLGKRINELPHLQLRGIQCYVGNIQHIKSYEERKTASLAAMTRAADVAKEFRANQLNCDVLTGTGTGTHDIDALIPEISDMQPGSYTVMDSEYAEIASKNHSAGFEPVFFGGKQGEIAYRPTPPMTLLSTVVSVAHVPRQITIDAGLKALYKDGGLPLIINPALQEAELEYDWFGDEHGKITVKPKEGQSIQELDAKIRGEFKLGRVVEIMVSHCDPTINLFDFFFVTDDKETVVEVWPIDLRGCSQ